MPASDVFRGHPVLHSQLLHPGSSLHRFHSPVLKRREMQNGILLLHYTDNNQKSIARISVAPPAG